MTMTTRLFNGKLFEGGLFNGGIFEGGANALASLIASLFGAGEQGGMYLPGLDTCYTDNGTTLCTAPGDLVYRINDSSGNGNHAIQATAASRPILRQDGGGRYYLEFDGVDDYLIAGAIDLTATDKVTIFAGVRKSSDAARASILSHNGTTYRSFGVEAPTSASAYNMLLYSLGGSLGRNPRTISGLASPITYTFISVCDIADTGTATYYLNGVKGADNSTPLTGASKYTNSYLYIGKRSGSDLPFSGNIYSMIIRGAASSTNQITAAEAYVNSKTGAY